MKEKGFFKRNGGFLGASIAFVAILMMFLPILTYRTRVIVDGEKIDTYFNVNVLTLLQDNINPAWPVILMMSLLFISTVMLFIANMIKDNKKVNSFYIISLFASLISICILLAYREIFDNYGSALIENYKDVSIAYGFAILLTLFVIVGAISLLLSDYSNLSSTKAIAENSILIASAFVLNFIKIPTGTGGSINLQMLPLMIIALRRGPVGGFVYGGIIYGALTCLTDGYGFATFPFDYLIGFGSVAVLGLFKDLINRNNGLSYLYLIIGGLLSTLVRFIGSTASSMIIYNYQLIPALIYNAIYIPVSGVIALIVLIILFKPLMNINKKYPVQDETKVA